MSIREQLRQPGQPGQPGKGKTITGHDVMDIARFFEETRHMIVYDVLEWECPVGDKGERIRIFLSEEGYQKAVESARRGEMKIIRHARICKGKIFYKALEHAR